MSIYKISYNNIKRNFKNYLLYFISILFSAFIFFTFNSIRYNEDILKAAGSIASGLIISSIVVVFFAFIFIYNANTFFREKRRQEIGLYNLLGITKKKIGLIFIYEGFILGLLGVIGGIILGFIFSKLLMMLLVRLMGIDIIIHLNFNLKAIIQTFLVFFAITVILSIENYMVIKKIPLVRLFKKEKEVDSLAKISVVKGILGILLITVGYGISLSSKTTVGRLDLLIIILVIVIIGTKLFYKSALPLLLKGLKKFQNFYFKGSNMISLSEIAYKVKSNADILTTVTILIAVCVTALGTTSSFYYDFQKTMSEKYKFSNIIVQSSDTIKNEVDNVLKDYNEEILFNDNIEFKLVKGSYVNTFLSVGKSSRDEQNFEVLSESNYKRLMDYENREYENLPSEEDVYLIEDSSMTALFETNLDEPLIFSEGERTFKIKKSYSEMLTNELISGTIVVVKDSVYSSLGKIEGLKNLRCIDVKDRKNSFELSKSISKIADANKVKLSSYAYTYSSGYKVLGMLFFIGIVLSILFIIATGSLILFKQISNIYDNKERYVALKKIGANNSHIKKILLKQTSIIFLLPVLLGTTHNLFAMRILKSLLGDSIIIPTIITLIVYYLAYGMFYLGTVAYSKTMIIKK
ncbi:FtsX-like permease family protein [Clostridium sp. MSJ-11]|uniref:FtsX-like permease family protein n=1 Tax=Clostridium mobile TaxID=2841512 RepID=A0ABS6EGZ8_9CLOT|nr:FtsX-like permease family protein [Clostridium mobile]MBU5484486.1 FtsX-like permease family protein [Clostridium mobile]